MITPNAHHQLNAFRAQPHHDTPHLPTVTMLSLGCNNVSAMGITFSENQDMGKLQIWILTP
jgi:hypothetical protein